MKAFKFIISFFIIFSFPIPIFYSSILLSVIMLMVAYVFDFKLVLELILITRHKFFLSFVTILVIIILLSIFTALIHQSYDFSILKANILALITVSIAFIAYPVIVKNIEVSERFVYLIRQIIYLFIVQSLIEIMAFINPSFADFVHFFQKAEVASKNMGGLRALALTGNPFFDLSSGFAIIYVLFFFDLVYRKDISMRLIDILKLVLIFIGSFFAGRTAFIGLGIGMIFYIFCVGNRINRIFGILKLFTFITLFGYLLYFVFLPNNVKEIVETRLLPFAFEFVYSYMDTGKFTTESTEILNQMYFPIPLSTVIFGDGYYTGLDGAYYLNTDAGIMRNILFYGLFGLLFIVFSHFALFYKPLKIVLVDLSNKTTKSGINLLLFFITLCCTYLILHYKGEVLLFLPIAQIILVWVLLSFLDTNNTKSRIE